MKLNENIICRTQPYNTFLHNLLVVAADVDGETKPRLQPDSHHLADPHLPVFSVLTTSSGLGMCTSLCVCERERDEKNTVRKDSSDKAKVLFSHIQYCCYLWEP